MHSFENTFPYPVMSLGQEGDERVSGGQGERLKGQGGLKEGPLTQIGKHAAEPQEKWLQSWESQAKLGLGPSGV